jgi:aminoglycoside phosphotransferase (APT) family kinase protein
VNVPLAAVRDRLPGVVGRRVARVEHGWDFDVRVLDGEWIVRVPRRPEVARRVTAETALLELLGPALPVAVPRFEAVGDGELPWVAYRRLRGRPIARGARAGPVAAFLAALHTFPTEPAARVGIPARDWRHMLGGVLDGFEHRALPLLDPEERRLAAARFRDYREDESNFAFRPAVVHADLGPEHLLCAPDGTLTGVIDWTDAVVGDPALDFAWLLHGLGERFASDLLAAYGRDADPGLPARAAFYHLLGPWHEVTYGLELGDRRWVESGLAGVRERLL